MKSYANIQWVETLENESEFQWHWQCLLSCRSRSIIGIQNQTLQSMKQFRIRNWTHLIRISTRSLEWKREPNICDQMRPWVSWTLRNKLQWHFYRNSNILQCIFMFAAKCSSLYIALSVSESCEVTSIRALSRKIKHDPTFMRNVAHTLTPNWPDWPPMHPNLSRHHAIIMPLLCQSPNVTVEKHAFGSFHKVKSCQN